MSKALAGLLVALMLGVGLAVGVVAGGLIAGNNATPAAGRDRVGDKRADAQSLADCIAERGAVAQRTRDRTARIAVGRALPVGPAEPDA